MKEIFLLVLSTNTGVIGRAAGEPNWLGPTLPASLLSRGLTPQQVDSHRFTCHGEPWKEGSSLTNEQRSHERPPCGVASWDWSWMTTLLPRLLLPLSFLNAQTCPDC